MSEGRDKTERMRNREFVRTFESDIGLMSEVFEFISESLAACGVSRRNSAILEMAADEIFSNIAKYSKSPDVTVALNVGEGLVEMSFEDRGIPFDPLSAAPPDLSFGDEDHLADVNERNGGGFGIHLTRSLMDGMSYSRDGGRNVLILAKRLRDDECPGV